ncbi:MAG: MBL fold metallo-hydrolase [Calditrichaeota bacterium]|nr:MBL fold metallo-hydrolase [Calditrichota bacterium]
MKIGRFNVSSVRTGSLGLDGGAMFGVVPKAIWNKTNPADEMNRIDLATRSLLIEVDDRKLLVDTGMGDKWPDKYKEMYKVADSTIDDSLAKLGLKKTDITDVILTHLHFDHTGGSTVYNGDQIVETFPNATYYCSRKNWEWANHPTEKDKASYLTENFLPLYERKKLTILDNLSELGIDGISSIESNGHTIGMWLLKLSDADQTIAYCADMIPTSSHIPVPFVMGYDLYPMTTIEEKKQILQQAVTENWILFFEHDINYDAAYIELGEKGYRMKSAVSLN